MIFSFGRASQDPLMSQSKELPCFGGARMTDTCDNIARPAGPLRRLPRGLRWRFGAAGKDHERRGPMRQKAALGVDDPRLARDHAPATPDRAPFGADAARVLGDGLREVDLGLDRRIAPASRDERMG